MLLLCFVVILCLLFACDWCVDCVLYSCVVCCGVFAYVGCVVSDCMYVFCLSFAWFVFVCVVLLHDVFCGVAYFVFAYL